MKGLVGPVVTCSSGVYFRTVFANSQIENWRRADGTCSLIRYTPALKRWGDLRWPLGRLRLGAPDISGAVALRLHADGSLTQH